MKYDADPKKKYINFEDMHNDGIGGVTEITEAEFAMLEPYRDELKNCDPLPDKLDALIETIMERDMDEDMDVDSLRAENSLLFRIC